MRFKSILALSVLLTSTFISASIQAFEDWPKIHHSNFLVGGGIGYLSQEEDFESNATIFSSHDDIDVVRSLHITKERLSNTTRAFNVLAGWQWHRYRWLLGIEGDVTFQTLGSDKLPRSFAFRQVDNAAPLDPTDVAGTINYHRGPVFALTGRIGWFFTPGFMPYVRLGAQVSRDEAQFQLSVAEVFPDNVSYAQVFFREFYSKKKSICGFVGAFGLEFPTFIGASTLRFEYKHVVTKPFDIEETPFPIVGTHRFKRPQTSQIGAMWVWNFV